MTEDAKMPSGDCEGSAEPPSVNPALDVGIDPPGPVAFAKRRRVPIAIALVVLLALGGFFAFGRSGGPSEEAIARDAWLLCTFLEDRSTSTWLEKTADEIADEPGKYQALVKVLCGVEIRKLDGGWTFAYRPSEDLIAKSGFSVFQRVLLQSGCLSDLDVEKLRATRPLDGRVSSTDGRSSWTYSSSTGVSLICSS